jgi:hypothetical protein
MPDSEDKDKISSNDERNARDRRIAPADRTPQEPLSKRFKQAIAGAATVASLAGIGGVAAGAVAVNRELATARTETAIAKTDNSQAPKVLSESLNFVVQGSDQIAAVDRPGIKFMTPADRSDLGEAYGLVNAEKNGTNAYNTAMPPNAAVRMTERSIADINSVLAPNAAETKMVAQPSSIPWLSGTESVGRRLDSAIQSYGSAAALDNKASGLLGTAILSEENAANASTTATETESAGAGLLASAGIASGAGIAVARRKATTRGR